MHRGRWPVLAALTVLAFGLRARGLREGLYIDEQLTLMDVSGRDLVGVLDIVANGPRGDPVEKNPPLFFVLAWLSVKVGEPTTSVRLPSLVFGTACVPLVFLIGRRTVGRAAGLVAAGLMALSPFAIYYGIEARGYALLMFLSALSTLLLLKAVELRRPAWWVGYALAVTGILYTHYLGVFVVAAQGAWTLWYQRACWRALVLSYVGAALAFAPWLPHIQPAPDHFGPIARFFGVGYGDALLQWMTGHPELSYRDVPGVPALLLLGSGVAIGLLARLINRPRRPPESSRALAPGGVLVLILAAASPIGALAYGVAGDDIFLFPRNLTASLPFAALALGWALTPRDRAVAVVTVGLAAAGLGIAAGKTLEDEHHRPDYPGVAKLLDERAGTDDLVFYHGGGIDPAVLDETVSRYFERHHLEAGADAQPVGLAQLDPDLIAHRSCAASARAAVMRARSSWSNFCPVTASRHLLSSPAGRWWCKTILRASARLPW